MQETTLITNVRVGMRPALLSNGSSFVEGIKTLIRSIYRAKWIIHPCLLFIPLYMPILDSLDFKIVI